MPESRDGSREWASEGGAAKWVEPAQPLVGIGCDGRRMNAFDDADDVDLGWKRRGFDLSARDRAVEVEAVSRSCSLPVASAEMVSAPGRRRWNSPFPVGMVSPT
ncbi:hypothetical protein Isop_3620 [Isosphaera pallida ATCC 43644]|uniref:Uncharacterized protein n=1 Tax=Isosphaera pallida (strain ATCC 43644 / DSM 9630 / IS1B) TaxID=575540 RepID=E8QYJ4_ISOPI|nr:hypothetical protein Isop_3620 [Isosphaera pallida ATCC 43644]